VTITQSLPSAPLDTSATVAGQFLSRPGLLERVVLTTTLFVYAWSTPFEWATLAQGNVATSNPLTQAVFLALLGCTVIALNGNWHIVLRAAGREPLIPTLLAIAALSTLWSTQPIDTFQQAFVMAATYLTAMHLVVRFTPREILGMLGVVFAIGAVLNLGAVLVFSQGSSMNLGLSTGGGAENAWRGVTAQRNALGRAAVLGFLCCALNARINRSTLLWPFFAVLNLVLLLGSNSATSLGACAGLIALAFVVLGFRGRKTLYGATALSMTVVFSCLTLLAAIDLAAFTGFLGRDTTFTGRVPLWSDSIAHGISKRPWLGYGWDGFWPNDYASFDVLLRSHFDAPHAHNWFIDAWLMVGPVGALLSVAIYLRGLVWSTQHIRRDGTAIGLFPTLVISLGVIYSLTEAGFISRSIQFIMLIVAISLASGRASRPDVGAPAEALPPSMGTVSQ